MQEIKQDAKIYQYDQVKSAIDKAYEAITNSGHCKRLLKLLAGIAKEPNYFIGKKNKIKNDNEVSLKKLNNKHKTLWDEIKSSKKYGAVRDSYKQVNKISSLNTYALLKQFFSQYYPYICYYEEICFQKKQFSEEQIILIDNLLKRNIDQIPQLPDYYQQHQKVGQLIIETLGIIQKINLLVRDNNNPQENCVIDNSGLIDQLNSKIKQLDNLTKAIDGEFKRSNKARSGRYSSSVGSFSDIYRRDIGSEHSSPDETKKPGSGDDADPASTPEAPSLNS